MLASASESGSTLGSGHQSRAAPAASAPAATISPTAQRAFRPRCLLRRVRL